MTPGASAGRWWRERPRDRPGRRARPGAERAPAATVRRARSAVEGPADRMGRQTDTGDLGRR